MSDSPFPPPDELPRLSPEDCGHEDFHVQADVIRITDDQVPAQNPIGYMVDLTVTCRGCHTPMVFVGLPVGVSYYGPTTTPSGDELRAPISPKSELVQLAMGQAVVVREPGSAPDAIVAPPHGRPVLGGEG